MPCLYLFQIEMQALPLRVERNFHLLHKQYYISYYTSVIPQYFSYDINSYTIGEKGLFIKSN